MKISVEHTILFYSDTYIFENCRCAIAEGMGTCEHKELDITYEKPVKNILIEEGVAVISVPGIWRASCRNGCRTLAFDTG